MIRLRNFDVWHSYCKFSHTLIHRTGYHFVHHQIRIPKSAAMAPATLPEGFLSGPAPNLTRTDIDLQKNGIVPHYDNLWATVLDGVLSEEECDVFLAAAESTTDGEWERAMVNIGGGMQAMYEDTRKCGRIIWDDKDVVAKLWARIADAVPDIHELNNRPHVTGNGPAKRNETWKLTRLNERMRFLKYIGGEYFKGLCR